MNKDSGEKKHNAITGRIIKVAVCIAIIVAIVLIALNFDAIRRAFKFSAGESGSRMETFYYSANADNTFAAVGDGLAMASRSGVQYFSSDGGKAFSDSANMSSPALHTSNGLTAALSLIHI